MAHVPELPKLQRSNTKQDSNAVKNMFFSVILKSLLNLNEELQVR